MHQYFHLYIFRSHCFSILHRAGLDTCTPWGLSKLHMSASEFTSLPHDLVSCSKNFKTQSKILYIFKFSIEATFLSCTVRTSIDHEVSPRCTERSSASDGGHEIIRHRRPGFSSRLVFRSPTGFNPVQVISVPRIAAPSSQPSKLGKWSVSQNSKSSLSNP